jgi:hypothetical protein
MVELFPLLGINLESGIAVADDTIPEADNVGTVTLGAIAHVTT